MLIHCAIRDNNSMGIQISQSKAGEGRGRSRHSATRFPQGIFNILNALYGLI